MQILVEMYAGDQQQNSIFKRILKNAVLLSVCILLASLVDEVTECCQFILFYAFHRALAYCSVVPIGDVHCLPHKGCKVRTHLAQCQFYPAAYKVCSVPYATESCCSGTDIMMTA